MSEPLKVTITCNQEIKHSLMAAFVKQEVCTFPGMIEGEYMILSIGVSLDKYLPGYYVIEMDMRKRE
jgi:hypothetical protein